MSAIKENEIISKMIDELLEKGQTEISNKQFQDKDNIIKLRLLRMMFQSNEEKEILYYNINKLEMNSNIKKMITSFIINLKMYSLESCIENRDTISNCYYSIKDDKLFISYFNQMKIKLIPFFQVVRFIAFLNNNTDISLNIINLIKNNKNIKPYIENYIEKIKGSLWKIIVLYNHLVLQIYEENELETEDSFLLFQTKGNLIGMLQKYVCYNDFYCDGEISSFITSLCKAFTYNLNCLYLKEGNDYALVNNLINIIFREICEKFKFKDYSNKKQMNELYDLIAETIGDYCDITIGQNYANFVLEYCRFYNPGNKAIAKLFIEGLNKNNLKYCFEKILTNNNDNFYICIDKYIQDIKAMRNSKKNIKLNSNKKINKNNEVLNKDFNDDKTHIKIEERKLEEINYIKDKSLDNSNMKNIETKEINNKTSEEKGNKNIDKNIEERIKDNDEKELINKKFKELEKKINEQNKEIESNKKEIESTKKEIESNKKEIENIKVDFSKKSQESHLRMMKKLKNIQTELSELKKEMKKINFRDISKIIINNYITKYKTKLTSLYNKKEKAYHLLLFLKGKEKDYLKKILDTYYNSNIRSHISYVIEELNKKNIIGSPYDINYVANIIINDYCNKILNEKDDSNVKNYIDIKKIVNDLCEKYDNNKFDN